MTVPYDCDQTNIDHLRAVIAEQEQTIKYLHEHCKAEEVENAKLRELLSSYWKAAHCHVTPNVPRDYLAEMRELGVEVD